MGPTWTPASWRDLPVVQQPVWPDVAAVDLAEKHLGSVPPLVFAGEARQLTEALGEVAGGRAFLLQAGDCAESFSDFSADAIRDKLKVILQMAVVLTYSSGVPVVKVGRIAGQFAKPRSSDTELVDGTLLPSFRGHSVNDDAPTTEARTPDPQRLVQAYHQAASTLNLLRAFTKGGYADLSQVQTWNQQFVTSSPQGKRYDQLAGEISRAMSFMRACGIDLDREASLHQVDFWTSHEALLLGYEQALTRCDSLTGDWYDCSAHMLWVGERTRQLDHAHVAFLEGVRNPIGVKLGPTATPEAAVALAHRLNPDRIPGRLSFIIRMGSDGVRHALPPVVAAMVADGTPVVWACDPMHGNTFTATSGRKTRRFEVIVDEVAGFFEVCRAQGVWPGGLHCELTGDDVTECLGGGEDVSEDQLDSHYTSACDPRLNARQSVDLAFRVAELLRT